MARLAARQYGHVAVRQLHDLGYTRDAILARRRRGSLIPVHRRVYAVGHTRGDRHARWSAAVLAVEGSVLSHLSAAALHGIVDDDGPYAHVLSTRRAAHRRIVAHRTRRLPEHDVMHRAGLPVTTPLRTLFDLGAVLDPDALLKAAMEAEHRRLATLEDLVRHRPPGIGGPALRELLEHCRAHTRTELERRFLQLCLDHDLPRPEVNARVAGVRPDFLWREQRLVVETDGWQTHRSRRAFEADRRKVAILMAAGYDVLPVTWRQITREPQLVVRALRARLGR